MTAQKDTVLKQFALVFLLLMSGFSANAQIKYGFKTGLNFAHIIGESETSDAGADLETWKNTTGFHIGMTLAYKFTDNFGLRGELLYSKRGAKYTFDGQSYRIFNHASGSVPTVGTSRYLINLNNSYIDLPVLVYGRYKNFEISGGGYLGLLVQSVGEGSLRYSGKTLPPLNNSVYEKPNKDDTELTFNLNHNYRKDDPGEGTVKGETPVNIQVDGFTSETPKTLGAYYDYPAGSGRLYNSLDYGLVGGLSYYISSALYVHARVQYGLADITNNKADLSKARTGANGELLFRDDKDKNFMLQISVGFSF